MLRMSFQEFEDGKWADNIDECYDMYIVKDGDQFLYIGITKQHPWDRWFSFRGHMPQNADSMFFSTIGRRIYDNMPESKRYTIELYTIDEARELSKEEIMNHGYCAGRVGIETCEKFLIQKYRPFDNIAHSLDCSNNWGSVSSRQVFRNTPGDHIGLAIEDNPRLEQYSKPANLAAGSRAADDKSVGRSTN